MSAFLAVVKKELNSVVRDRTIVIAILIQLFIASFSSALLLGMLSLYDPDTVMQSEGGAVNIGMVSAGNNSLETFLRADGVHTLPYATLAGAENAFYRGQLDAILVAPADTGNTLEVKLYLADSNFASIIRMVIQEPLKQYENYLRAQRGIAVRYTDLPGKPATAFEFIYSVLLPMLMFFPAFVAGSMVIDSLTEEVENNTLQTLLSAPLSLNEMVSAKISAALLLAVMQCLAWLGLLRLNGIAVQNPGWVICLAVIVAGITSGGAAVLAALFRDRERSQFIYSLALLAGAAGSTLLGFSPIQTLARLAVGDFYAGGWNVAIFAAFLALLWLLLWKVAHRIME
ncbi:MAG: ABC transporter permease [Anaerolineales bacterium]